MQRTQASNDNSYNEEHVSVVQPATDSDRERASGLLKVIGQVGPDRGSDTFVAYNALYACE